MADTSLWSVVHEERRALAADLGSLDDAQWETESLCPNWTVRDVLAPMTATATMTPPAFFGKMIASGFKFETVQTKGVAANRGASPAEGLASFKVIIDSTKHPPGPGDSWLGEVLVHSQDIRRPLGIAHDYPIDSLVRAASFYKGSNLLIGTKKRIEGLQLKATDADWSTGSGPLVSGPMASLLMAMTGRKAALADLSGDGVAALGERP